MSDTLEIRVRLAERAQGRMRAADLALLLEAIERGVRAVAPQIALPRLAIAEMDEFALRFQLTICDPELNKPLSDHPLLALVQAQAAERDGLHLETALSRRINSIDLSCGGAHATACNTMSYDNWPETQSASCAAPTTTRPWTPPPEDHLLDFDAAEFNREIAEARRSDHQSWWESDAAI